MPLVGTTCVSNVTTDTYVLPVNFCLATITAKTSASTKSSYVNFNVQLQVDKDFVATGPHCLARWLSKTF